jgi:hypothetical protein
MRTSKSFIVIVGLAASIIALPASAQDTSTTNTVPLEQGSNAPASGLPTGGLLKVGEDVLKGLMSSTNYVIAPYVSYGLDNHKVGGGILALYNFNNFVGAGLGVDYVGQFSAISGNVELKLPLRPLSFTGWAWATNIVTTPFAYSGLGTPMSGAGTKNGGVSTHIGAGLNFDICTLWGGQVSIGGAWITRSGAGDYSGKYANGFFAWRKGF